MADLEAAWKKKYGVGDGAQEAQGQNAPSESVMFSAPSVKAEPRVDLEAAWHKRYGLEPPAARPQTSTSTEERAVKEREQGLPLGAVRITYGGELSKAQKHYNDLIRLGANPNEAHLLTGAAASESEFNPTAIHDNRTGYGLYGHRLDRRDALFKFAGTNTPSSDQQNAFALQELRSRPEYNLVQNAKNARDLAIAQMHFERPLGYTPENPMGGHNFAGRLETLNKFANLRGEGAGIETSPLSEADLKTLASKWGPGHAFSSGVALGFGPQIEAALRSRSLFGGENYERELEQFRSAEKAYKELNPLTGYGSEAIGTLASTAIPVAKAGQILARGAEAAGVAPNILRFLGGEAGQAIPQVAERMPGIAGTATRTASAATKGALEGAGQVGLEAWSQAHGGSLGDTETPLMQQLATGTLIGGAAGPLVSKLVSPKVGGALMPEWEAGARQAGQRALQEFNIPVQPGQFAKGEAKEFFRQTGSPELLNEQVKRFSEEAAKIIGAKDLTPEGIKAAKKQMGQGFDAIAAGVAPMQMTRPVFNKFASIGRQASNVADRTTRNTIRTILSDINTDLAAGRMNGQLFQSYTQKGGLIDQKLAGLENSVKKYYGGELQTAMKDLFKQNDPVRAQVWERIKNHYNDAISLEKLTTTSGIVDPQKLAANVKKRGSGTALSRLAPAGQFLPKVDATGAAITSGATGLAEKGGFRSFLFKHPLEVAAATEAASETLLGEPFPFLGKVLKAGGPLVEYGVPGAIAALGTSRGMRKAATKQMLKNPAIRKMVFEEQLGPHMRNVLTGPGVRTVSGSYAPTLTTAKRRQEESKK